MEIVVLVSVLVGLLGSATVAMALGAPPNPFRLSEQGRRARHAIALVLLWLVTLLACWLLPESNGNYTYPWWWLPLVLVHGNLSVPPMVACAYVKMPLLRAIWLVAAYLWSALCAIVVVESWILYNLSSW